MKILFILFILHSSISFGITPQLNDLVEFEMQVKTGKETFETFNWRVSIVEISKTRKNENFLVEYDSIDWGVDQQWLAKESLGYITDIDSFCADKKMSSTSAETSIEIINTPAGEFKTCRVHSQSKKTTWFSEEVPFGLVKEEDEKSKKYLVRFETF